MQFLYNTGIGLFGLVARLAAPFNTRAALMTKGRAGVWDQLAASDLRGQVVWVHCASLGEFEQGRPLIEAIKKQHPDYKVVLTFFSPSGYEVRKNYDQADVVVYLPADTRKNAQRFIRAVHPDKVYFVKYEYWYHFFSQLKRANIPLYSVSSIFRKEQIFFKGYGGWFRDILKCVTRFYVQDEQSAKLLTSLGIHNHVVAGDTRFDRVTAIAAHAAEVPVIADFAEGAQVLVAGSSWPQDEAILADFINHAPANVKCIVAPHEVHESHITQLIARFRVPVFRYSKLNGPLPSEARVLVIDTIGLLSSIYRYGSVAYIGGGFGKGIHNTLEAATYGMPVIFGPHHKKFKEAMDLIQHGAGFPISDKADFITVMENFWSPGSEATLKVSGEQALRYVQSMCGATSRILKETF
ncbi:MAG: 3-deoxy-D-manno-octulosonic acid transferase [Bacteroidales bacterium]|nr:3-deoxy-D-manno-octulosonic acid transferase [Bacteroidales bacterium]